MDYLNENHVDHCQILMEGPDLTASPVKFVSLRERGGFDTYTVPVVASGRMTVSVNLCEPIDIEVLVFRPGTFPCIDMMLDPVLHVKAKQQRIAAAVKVHKEEDVVAQTRSAEHPVLESEKDDPVPTVPGRKGGKSKTEKRTPAKSPEMAAPLDPLTSRTIPCSHSSAIVSFGQIIDNTARAHSAARVAIHAHLSQTRIFWLEDVAMPASAIWIGPSRTIRASFSSATSDWHVVRLLLKDNGFNPRLELAPKRENDRHVGAADRLWSVFFVASDKTCFDTSFAAIMCPEHCILREPRGNGGRQLTTNTDRSLIHSRGALGWKILGAVVG